MELTTRFIQVGSGYRDAVDIGRGGKGSFLLVHGLASNARMWDGVAAELSSAGYAVAIVDQRGHGRSDKPSDGFDFTTLSSDLAEIVNCVMLDYGFSKPVAVGQSWGASVVESFALSHPGLVAGIAAIDGGMSALFESFPLWEDCMAALSPPDMTGIPWKSFESRVRFSHSSWPETGIQGILANVERLADDTVRPWLSRENHMTILKHLWQHNPYQICAKLEVPVLFVPAGGDPERDPHKRACLDRLAAVTTNFRTAWFEQSHHDIHAQFPKELAELLIQEKTVGLFA